MSRSSKSESLLTSWQRALRDDRTLSTRQKTVAAFLSFRMKPDGAGAFPGAVLLAEDTGFSRRAVEQALRELVGIGWLVVVRRANKRAGLATEYGIAFPGAVDNSPNDELLPANGDLLPANGDVFTGTTFRPSMQLTTLHIQDQQRAREPKKAATAFSPAEFVAKYGDVRFRATFVDRVETYTAAPADKELTIALWDEMNGGANP